MVRFSFSGGNGMLHRSLPIPRVTLQERPMPRILTRHALIPIAAALWLIAGHSATALAADAVHPVKISQAQIAGTIEE
jgi:hypothetical protein